MNHRDSSEDTSNEKPFKQITEENNENIADEENENSPHKEKKRKKHRSHSKSIFSKNTNVLR